MTPEFDPNAAALEGAGIFGLPHSAAEAAVHVLPVPFDATTSYRKGAALAPEAVLAASRQVELFDIMTGRPYEAGIHLLASDPRLAALQVEAAELAAPILARGGELGGDAQLTADRRRVDAIGAELNAIVGERTAASMAEGKLVAVLGGDHSTPFGAIEACAVRHPGLGLLHVDAHADLRSAYEGFTWSHASILHNVLERLPGVARVVQFGIRDLCEEELGAIESSGDRIRTVFDTDWMRVRHAGEDLRPLVRDALDALPDEVWVSFDVDGLEHALCPNTGTPVPGGLTWHDAMLVLSELMASGRRVVGLDLSEVSPGPAGDPGGTGWDAIVGARLLYRLIGVALATRAT